MSIDNIIVDVFPPQTEFICKNELWKVRWLKFITQIMQIRFVYGCKFSPCFAMDLQKCIKFWILFCASMARPSRWEMKFHFKLTFSRIKLFHLKILEHFLISCKLFRERLYLVVGILDIFFYEEKNSRLDSKLNSSFSTYFTVLRRRLEHHFSRIVFLFATFTFDSREIMKISKTLSCNFESCEWREIFALFSCRAFGIFYDKKPPHDLLSEWMMMMILPLLVLNVDEKDENGKILWQFDSVKFPSW